jgi:hypothetical protein
MNNIPTIQHVFCPHTPYKPVLSSVPPADWCQHNVVSYLCTFCKQLKYEYITNTDGQITNTNKKTVTPKKEDTKSTK